MPRPQRGWRRKRYALVHVRPDGSRRLVAERFTTWAVAFWQAEALVQTLRMEAERGNPEAAGVVELVDGNDETVRQRLLIGETPAAGR